MSAAGRPSAATLALTLVTMVAFAGNSLLCRAALGRTGIDPASFTALRLGSGALSTWLLVCFLDRTGPAPANAGQPRAPMAGTWSAALGLFVYAAAFSFAYRHLTVGTGALLLFPAGQATLVVGGLFRGDRPGPAQVAGLAVSMAGLALLLGPGATAPPLGAALLMLAAGAAWGIYTLLIMGGGHPARATAGNFLRTVPLALGLGLATAGQLRVDAAGAAYALVSGAVASGLGYVLWYRAVAGLRASAAAAVQLSVPVLTVLAGLLLLGEPLTLRLAASTGVILAGVGLVLFGRHRA
jgi:drug/metabolite transporter (DMT)-like permease